MHKPLIVLMSILFMISCSAGPTKQTPHTRIGNYTPTIPTDIRATLNSHNSVRSQLGLPPLRWSNTLVKYARQWADHQAQTQNCSMVHRPHGSGPYKQVHGENLFWASPKRWSDGRSERQNISIQEVIKSWADEVVDYDYNSNSCNFGEQCGHYTQMVWRETREVGCVRTTCGDKSQLWVCNYNPPGNYIGERPY